MRFCDTVVLSLQKLQEQLITCYCYALQHLYINHFAYPRGSVLSFYPVAEFICLPVCLLDLFDARVSVLKKEEKKKEANCWSNRPVVSELKKIVFGPNRNWCFFVPVFRSVPSDLFLVKRFFYILRNGFVLVNYTLRKKCPKLYRFLYGSSLCVQICPLYFKEWFCVGNYTLRRKLYSKCPKPYRFLYGGSLCIQICPCILRNGFVLVIIPWERNLTVNVPSRTAFFMAVLFVCKGCFLLGKRVRLFQNVISSVEI